ncbi:MAG TPA: hypothetical protein VGP62_19005 [Bryobacteraceae bacterium]|nr:hypothetical protein [Bryobacteraceae bacterium]
MPSRSGAWLATMHRRLPSAAAAGGWETVTVEAIETTFQATD